MSYQFLQTITLWCTLAAGGGYLETIDTCRREALKCAVAPTDTLQLECISKVELRKR